MQGPNQTSYLTLGGFLYGAPTLQGPILATFLILLGKSNFIKEFNKSYQCNPKRHRNYCLPNLFLASLGGSNHAGPKPNMFPNPASCMGLLPCMPAVPYLNHPPNSAGKSNFIKEFNKSYHCNTKRHCYFFLPNLF